MAVTAVSGVEIRRPVPRLRRLEDERWLALALLVPTAVLLGLFIAYPFFEGVMLSLSSARVGIPGEFIGLKNFSKIWDDSIFRTAVWNTFMYTAVTTVFKLALGLWLAMLLNRHFKGKALVRAFILLPFIVPTVLSTFAWKWMFDPTFIVNIWRGVPFFAISLLAGLQTISPELNEAAAIDGARPWNRFWYVTWPLLLPVTMVVLLFSVIQTFADFQLVYVMTGGGPANATHLFATYAYQLGIGTGLLSEGAAISLAMFPFLFIIVVVQLLYIRRVEIR